MSTTTILRQVHVYGTDEVNGQPLGFGYEGDGYDGLPVSFRLSDVQRDRVRAAFDAGVEIDLDLTSGAFLFEGAQS